MWIVNYLGKAVKSIDAWVPLRPSESVFLVEGPRNLHSQAIMASTKTLLLKVYYRVSLTWELARNANFQDPPKFS